MKLRERKQEVNYGEKKAATKTQSATVDEISDDSSADESVAVACNRIRRVPAHKEGKSRKADTINSCSILKFTKENVVNTADPSRQLEVAVPDSEDEDTFESPPARKKGRAPADPMQPNLRRSNRSLAVSYKEISSSSDEEDIERYPIKRQCSNDLPKFSDFAFKLEKNVEGQECSRKRGERVSRAREAGGLGDEASDLKKRAKRVCTLKPSVERPTRVPLKAPVEVDSDVQPSAEKLIIEKQAAEEFPPVTYTVGNYGLEVDGKFCSVVKSMKQVEKILAVRDRSSGCPVYCVKEWNKSYKSAVSVTEAVLQKCCPQLLRNFLKRLDALERVDGHIGEIEKGPAFDPQFLIVDRIVASEHRGRTKKFYVKWKGLPYSDATWEPEACICAEKEAIDRFNRCRSNSFGDARNILSGFKDGRALRDYQKDGVAWLDRNFQLKVNCILADEMGLGKTIQSVAMLESLRYKRKIKGPFLIVAPVSTLGHWQREIESLTSMNCVVYMGSHEDRAIIQQYEFWNSREKSACQFTVLLSSFEILLKDQTFLGKISWQYIIVDEAHRLKSKESKTSCALGSMEVRKGGLLLLTGTPIQNNTKEIFSLLSLLDPEEFNSEERFMEKYGNIKDIEQVKDLQENILRPRLLRRMKEDVEKSIPQKEETIIWVELTKEQRNYYRAIYENRILDLLKGSHLPNLRNMAMELRKLCNHPFLCDGIEEDFTSKFSTDKNSSNLVRSSGKMVLLDKLLPMLQDAGRRVLIFSQFTIMLDILEDYLSSKGYSFERIDGKIRGSERQAAIDRYSASDSKTFVFLLSTRAGGLGITLTAADTCIIYDSDWNPQNDLQAMARCHRIGQTKDVKIYRLITRNTYEQHLFECSSRKYGLDEAILGKIQDEQQDFSKNIENLLRHGAYDMLREDGEAEAAAFSGENIDHILEQRTQKRTIGGRGNNTFSVATFVSVEDLNHVNANDDLDMGAEEFWKKMLPEACEQKLIERGKKIVAGRRRRAKVDYREDAQGSSGDDEDNIKNKGGSKQIQEECDVATENGKHWSEQELKRLEHSLALYGKLETRKVMVEARLEHRSFLEVEEVVNAIVQLCEYLQAKRPESDGSGSAEYPTLPLVAERVFKTTAFMHRLERNASKYLQVFHEREVIASAVAEKDLHIELPRSKKLPLWWDQSADVDLLKGVHRHGHKGFRKIKLDRSLCFASKYSSIGSNVNENNLETDTHESSEALHLCDDWPSDAVLSGRVKKLVMTSPNGLTGTEKKKRISGQSQGQLHAISFETHPAAYAKSPLPVVQSTQYVVREESAGESPGLKQSRILSQNKRVVSEKPDTSGLPDSKRAKASLGCNEDKSRSPHADAAAVPGYVENSSSDEDIPCTTHSQIPPGRLERRHLNILLRNQMRNLKRTKKKGPKPGGSASTLSHEASKGASGANKENEIPVAATKNLKCENSNQKQQSLLGYFSPKARSSC